MVLPVIKRDNRVEAQTVREWVYEYTQGEPVWPSSWGSNVKEGYIVVPDDYRPVFKDTTTPIETNRTWVIV